VHVSLSHEVVGTFREFERAATTEVDAALSPLLRGYLGELGRRAGDAGLPAVEVMQSSGGVTGAAQAAGHAALTVLSGPAGGVGGALLLAAEAGEPDVLCFDMGGTSCDVCVIEGGTVRETASRHVAGRPLALPMLDIHTVGAGGGSIAWRDPGGALRVGPQSAGADPGPACYGRGGEQPTVTDANLLLGYLPADGALAGGVTLDAAAARAAIERLARELSLDALDCAAGIIAVANAQMLGALRVVTVQRGVDPRPFALMPFGGAGPLHATALATELGIRRILCPRTSGVLSALGLAAAAPRWDAARTVLWRGEALSGPQLAELVAALVREAGAGLEAEPVRVRVRYELRYEGQSFELAIEAGPDPAPGELTTAFAAAHRERYGFEDATAAVELVTVRVSVWGPAPPLALGGFTGDGARPVRHRARFGGVERDTALWRGELAPGTRLAGPAVCALPEATLVVEPGWSGEVDPRGGIVLRREGRPG
jgi:N-methylhydantoinase A